MNIEPGKTYIRKVTSRVASKAHAISRGYDTLALQLRLRNMLAAATLHPSGLPATAIVCIRTFRDPLPASLQLQGHSVRPSQAWEQAVATSLAQMVQRAVHPARDVVPANAEAVIFADRAELLACLASDWCEGNVTPHWWWQSLFKGIDIARTILPTWIEAPEYVPAALQHLAAMRKVVPFVRSLSTNDARILLQRIVQSFALHELVGITCLPDRVRKRNPVWETGNPLSGGQVTLDHDPAVAQPDRSTGQLQKTPLQGAPWQPWVPESTDAGLHLEQRCLLGIGLMLQRAPTVVRTTSFAHAATQWYLAEQFPAPSNEHFVPAGEPLVGILRRRDNDNMDTPVADSTLMQDNHAVISIPLEDTPVAISTPTQDTPVAVPPPPQSPHKELAVPQTGFPYRDTDEDYLSLRQGSYKEYPYEAQIETDLGGVFYLINLGLFLGLYGDFTTPAQPGLPLPIWDFVALLGQQLMGDKIQSDPLWTLLARLAGRSNQDTPGRDFVPPDSWRVPVEWLASFPETGTWQWCRDGGRLWLQHPAQFLLLDVPLDTSDPVQQLEREMQAYSEITNYELLPGELPGESSGITSLHHWLAWLMPYIHARLSRALALTNTDDLAHLLCEHHARVFVTATHLDIVLSLAELPIEIRMAGLDRNPGWVPAAGRFIAFHFE